MINARNVGFSRIECYLGIGIHHKARETQWSEEASPGNYPDDDPSPVLFDSRTEDRVSAVHQWNYFPVNKDRQCAEMNN